MQNTQETTARDLVGQLIRFMETGTPPDGLFTESVSAPSPTSLGGLHPALGDAAIRFPGRR